MPLDYDTARKYALRALKGDNVISDIDQGFKDLADDVASNMAGYAQGTLAARPTSSVGTPGIAGRHYYATDTKVEYLDTGTGWIALNASGRGAFNSEITPNFITVPNNVSSDPVTLPWDPSTFTWGNEDGWATLGSPNTASKYTPKIPGIYFFLLSVIFTSTSGWTAGTTVLEVSLKVNGTTAWTMQDEYRMSAASWVVHSTIMVHANGTTDFFAPAARAMFGTNVETAGLSRFAAYLVSPTAT